MAKPMENRQGLLPADRPLARVDLHLHSAASNSTDYFAANAFAIPESWSDPLALYDLLKSRGMALVTLTDHNSIDGVKRLIDAGRPDVFIASELTATFPEDGCSIHVTVANVTEAQFAEANRLRRNVYELLDWLEAERAAEASHPLRNRVAWFMTHPLMSTGNRPYGREGALRVEHLEKMLVLLECLETHNGARTRALNDLTHRLVTGLDPATILGLADRHDLVPRGAEPWRKAVVGGSDDHAGINPGRTWTEFPYAGYRPTANDLVLAIRNRETRPAGAHGGPITLAHAMLKLIHDGGRRRGAGPAGPRPALSGPVESLLRLVFDSGDEGTIGRAAFRARTWVRQVAARWRRRHPANIAFEAVLESEVYALLDDPVFRAGLAGQGGTDDRIFFVIKTLVNRIFVRYVERLARVPAGNVVAVIKELVALLASNVFVSLPYLVSYLQQSSDCLIARDVRRNFRIEARPRVVLVTDTFFEINGVSATIKRMLREAVRRDIDFTVVTCVSAAEREERLRDPWISGLVAAGRLRLFTSITSIRFPQYEELQVHVPPLLDLLRYLQESGCTKIQVSTPGPVGLTGLLAAKLLQIETAATYHTSFPEYVENYTRDVSLEALTWKYMILFYHSVDEVLVPSRFIARLLHKRGLRNRKLLILDRWVDPDRFHPGQRVADYFAQHGVAGGDSLTKFVYVGRVAVEKDLHLLAEAYRRLRAERPDAHLVILGDGPYREELARLLDGLPVTFTGFLEGDELIRALASCDVKLFPSTTDTWGNAPLEAQACGLPVVVSDIGGPAELMIDGVTGYRVAGRDVEGLHAAMRALMDPAARRRMGAAAREFIEANRIDEPFTAVLDSDAYRRRLHAGKERDALAEGPRVVMLAPATSHLAAAHLEIEALYAAGDAA
jgi:glycosyltransferase involved in cell wall biosynthesis